MVKKWIMLVALCWLMFGFSTNAAQDTTNKKIISIETTIVGTKDQPKLFSIVPWRSQSSYTKFERNKLSFGLDKEFAHIEPSELKKQLALYQQLIASKNKK